MKATLKLDNIGQRIGEEIWEFNSGVITEIRGRTASGKSRILKACALALSIPIISDEIRNNAISFGIAKAENKDNSPLLNSNKNKAVIELEYENKSIVVELYRDGTEKINIPGNQKFLYCSMLVENSKIHNCIDQGISDFSWKVTEMSLAKDYESILNIIESYSDLLSSKNEEVEKKSTEKEKNEILLKKRKKELQDINTEIEKVEKEIDAIEINPQLQKDRLKLIDDLKTLKNKQTDANKKYKNLQIELSNIASFIDKNTEFISKKLKELADLKKEIKVLKDLPTDTFNKEIDNLHNKKEQLYQSIGDIKEELGARRGKRKEYNDTLIILVKKGKNEILCWTCNKANINKDEVEKEILKINKLIEPLQEQEKTVKTEIENLSSKILNFQDLKKKEDEIPDLEIKYQNMARTIADKQEIKDESEKKKKRLEGQIPKYSADINSRTEEIKQKEKKMEEIDIQLEKNKLIKPKLDKKRTLTIKIGSVAKEISDIEDRIIQGAVVELLGFEIDISKARIIFKDLEVIFSEIKDHLTANIKEQREGAAIKFNDNISKIIKELNFSEFKEILLDLEDYNLNITRKDDTNQPINSLSGGEKVIVSSLLQISAKETYNPEIPFIVGDDIILKMDDERREIFYNYLKNIAKENDWFVILTRVTDEDLIKEEI